MDATALFRDAFHKTVKDEFQCSISAHGV